MENVLSRLNYVFEATKIKYVIVGGIAVIHYGHIRATQDIDIIIEDDYSKISQFLGLLKTYEFDVMMDQFQMAYKEKTNITIFDKNSFLRLDIKVADKKREYEVLNNATQQIIYGKKVNIAPLEYVLIGKLIYMGNVSDIPISELLEYQDVIDFLTIYHANKKDINLQFLIEKVKEMGLENNLNKLLEIKFD